MKIWNNLKHSVEMKPYYNIIGCINVMTIMRLDFGFRFFRPFKFRSSILKPTKTSLHICYYFKVCVYYIVQINVYEILTRVSYMHNDTLKLTDKLSIQWNRIYMQNTNKKFRCVSGGGGGNGTLGQIPSGHMFLLTLTYVGFTP